MVSYLQIHGSLAVGKKKKNNQPSKLKNAFFSEYTYIVHLEAINCLLVLLSVQLFAQSSAEYSSIYRIFMHNEQRARAPIIVCTLLNNFAQQQHAPPGLLSREAGGSIVFSIAGQSLKKE